MPKVDFPNIKDSNFRIVPEGEYDCELTEIEQQTSKNSNEMWQMCFEILEGEYKGVKVFDRLVFTEKALWKIKMICSRLGFDVSKELELEPDMLIGSMCKLAISSEEYEKRDGTKTKKNVITEYIKYSK